MRARSPAPQVRARVLERAGLVCAAVRVYDKAKTAANALFWPHGAFCTTTPSNRSYEVRRYDRRHSGAPVRTCL